MPWGSLWPTIYFLSHSIWGARNLFLPSKTFSFYNGGKWTIRWHIQICRHVWCRMNIPSRNKEKILELIICGNNSGCLAEFFHWNILALTLTIKIFFLKVERLELWVGAASQRYGFVINWMTEWVTFNWFSNNESNSNCKYFIIYYLTHDERRRDHRCFNFFSIFSNNFIGAQSRSTSFLNYLQYKLEITFQAHSLAALVSHKDLL